MKLWEVGATAPMVIGYRLMGMAPPGTPPSARQRRELNRMGQEKIDAWYEGALATGQRIFEANLALAGVFWSQVWGGALSPAAFTTPVTWPLTCGDRASGRENVAHSNPDLAVPAPADDKDQHTRRRGCPASRGPQICHE